MKWSEMSEEAKNALIAQGVMDWVPDGNRWVECDERFVGGKSFGVEIAEWSPITDISNAWQVLEKMRIRGHIVNMRGDQARVRPWGVMIDGIPCGNAPTAPEAICKAALMACGVEIEQ